MWTDEQRERYTCKGKRYASDLTDAEWNAITPLLQDCFTLTVNLREMINGRLYLDWTTLCTPANVHDAKAAGR